MAEEKKNLSISGSGTAPGGCYEDVRINGSGKIHGHVICSSMDINGSGRIGGDVKASRVTISGSGVIEKRLIAESLTVNGTCRAEESVSGERIQINGRAKVLEGVHGESVRVAGILSVGGDLEAEEIISEGLLTVGGLCSAERIDLTLSVHTSRIKEIGCGTLTVHRRVVPFLGQLLNTFSSRKLFVDSIEGDEIYLEHTEAKTVRGNHVTIGPGCSIGRVTYKMDYKKDEKAVVQTAVKE